MFFQRFTKATNGGQRKDDGELKLEILGDIQIES